MRGFIGGGAAGIAASILIFYGLFTHGIPAVALALWERSLRLIPMEVFGFLIVRLKFAARPLAFWGMFAGLVIGAGLVGMLLARWPRLRGRVALTLLAAFVIAIVPLAALAVAPASEFLAARLEAAGEEISRTSAMREILFALTLYAATFALIFTAITVPGARRLRSRPLSGNRDTSVAESGVGHNETGVTRGVDRVTRREAIRRGTTVVIGAWLGTTLARVVLAAGEGAGVAVAAAQSLIARIKGLPPEITPTKDFYVVSKNPPGFDPTVNAEKWRLEVSGLVGKPLRLTLDEIKAMPSVKQIQTLECISNEVGGDLISNAVWRGVRLKELLARAGGVGPKTFKIAFRCADGYTESLALVDAIQQDTVLAYEINGEPLPKAHGFPVRLLVPGLFGMKNPKWITKIEAVDYDFQGYWERSGWSDEAVVKTMSKFNVPALPRRTVGRVGQQMGLGGVAYGGDRGIQAVDISTDDGKTWRPADVKPGLGKYTWVLWAAMWTPTATGEYTLKVRARDKVGIVQTQRESPTLPDGASGYHTIRLKVTR